MEYIYKLQSHFLDNFWSYKPPLFLYFDILYLFGPFQEMSQLQQSALVHSTYNDQLHAILLELKIK